MSTRAWPSLRPILIGSLLVSIAVACRTDERTDGVQPATPQDTTSRNVPPSTPPEYPSSPERERMRNEPMRNEPLERMPVTGRDEAMDLGSAGAGGGGGAGGSH